MVMVAHALLIEYLTLINLNDKRQIKKNLGEKRTFSSAPKTPLVDEISCYDSYSRLFMQKQF